VASVASLAFVLQWMAFAPAWWRQTERWFDLAGSATFLTLVWLLLTRISGVPLLEAQADRKWGTGLPWLSPPGGSN